MVKIEDYIGIILGIFTGCILFDVINAFFHKPFFKFGLWMGKLVKHFLNKKRSNNEYRRRIF